MNQNYHYATVSQAIEELRKKGFTLDFNLEENCIVCESDKYNVDDFEITEIYRYEGDSDPADEATVYGIESADGRKGVLVNGYGIATDESANLILKKLRMHRDK